MCDPVTMAVLTVASTAGTLYAQQQAADMQDKANTRNYANQMTAYRYNTANANATKVQEAENLAAKKIDINAEARRKQATATVSAGEAGVSGLSVDGLMASIGAEGGRAIANAETNYLRADRAIETDKMNIWSGTASNIGQMKTPANPDYMTAALKIGTAIDTYQRGGT